MKHLRHHPCGVARHFHDSVAIQLEGSRDYGADFDVDVEFTARPDIPPGYDDPGSAGEREIVSVRPYEYVIKHGVMTTERRYLDCQAWLETYLKDCINVDVLEADWED